MSAPLSQQVQMISDELARVLDEHMTAIDEELENAGDGETPKAVAMLARVRALQRLANELAWAQADLAAAVKAGDSTKVARLEQRSDSLVTGLATLIDDLLPA